MRIFYLSVINLKPIRFVAKVFAFPPGFHDNQFSGFILLKDTHTFASDVLFRHAIRIDESADDRIIISRLEVIQSRLGIVVVASVAERILLTNCAGERSGGGKQLAPCVVGILDYGVPGSITDTDDIALQVLLEIVGCALLL